MFTYRIFIALSLLIVSALPINGFAENKREPTPSPSEALEPNTEETEPSWDEVEENAVEDVRENQAVKAENYKQAWDDAMVAAPAFDE